MSRRSKKRYYNRVRADLEDRIQEREMKREFWDEEGDDYEEDETYEKMSATFDMEAEEMKEEGVEGSIYVPKKWYVLDTNLILSCVNVLCDVADENWREPLDFEPDISDAHLVIPKAVFSELEYIRGQNSFEGEAARVAFRRLEKFFSTSECTLGEILKLEAPVPTGWGKQTISLMPCHRNFSNSLPWVPDDNDNDGWIAVTALAATMAKEGLPVDGTLSTEEMLKRGNNNDDVVLLTRDRPLLVRARDYGVKVLPYSFRKRRPYTGCRELEVPTEMLGLFLYKHELSREEFERYLPDELPLIDNEYVIMRSVNVPSKSISAFSNIARYNKKNGKLYPMRFVNHEGPVPPNAGIAMYYDALNDDKAEIIPVTGKAGTGKTHQAILHGIKEVTEGKKEKVVLFSTQKAENPTGTVPGDERKKTEHLKVACKSVIAAYLAETDEELIEMRRELKTRGGQKFKKGDVIHYGTSNSSEDKRTESNDYLNYAKELEKKTNAWFNAYFECYPYEKLKGMTFNNVIIIIDEAQRMHDLGVLKTMATRGGKNVKTIICGDIAQIDKATPEKIRSNGITYFQETFFDWSGCVCVHLTENMRGAAAGYENKNRAEARARIAGY